MYIRITNLCNMECAHCAFSSSPRETDTHMDAEVFIRALDMAAGYEDSISIGGGEPTVHPRFWDFIAKAVGEYDFESVWMATNGKRKQDALALLHLAYDPEFALDLFPEKAELAPFDRWGIFSVALSRDSYHEAIPQRTVDLFNLHKAEIRNVNWNIANVGAAARNQIPGRDVCACACICIEPDGTVKACGCPDALVLGHLLENTPDELCKAYDDFLVEDRLYNNTRCSYFGLNRHELT